MKLSPTERGPSFPQACERTLDRPVRCYKVSTIVERNSAVWLLWPLVVPLIFFFLCSVRIEDQGLYYDELHQVPAAFMLIGKSSYIFAPLSWHGFPLLTMPYGGATKSVIYGLWMKSTGLPFTIYSWRVLGIFLVMVGLALFYFGAKHGLTSFGLFLFSFAFLTDISVLITTRHDWGPTALSLSLRLMWLGIWIRLECAPSVRRVEAFFFGLLPAFCIFEKLSNLGFLGAFGLLVCFPGNKRYGKYKLVILSGLLLGFTPLLLVNILEPGVSFKAALDSVRSGDYGQILGQSQSSLAQILSLGAGDEVRSFVLGDRVPHWIQRVEVTLMATFMFAAAIVGVIRWRRSGHGRLMFLSTAGYFVVAAVTYLLPKDTWVNHWIAATPFQYVALGLSLRSGASGLHWRYAYGLLPISATVLVLFLLIRTINLWDTQVALGKGLASPDWDPSYTTIARFAADHREEGTFVLADWGFATAIYALSNGSFPVAEIFWNYRKSEDLLPAIKENPGKPLYVLSRRQEGPVNPAATEMIVHDVKQIAHQEIMPVESEIRNLRSVRVLKLKYPADRQVLVIVRSGRTERFSAFGYIDQIISDGEPTNRFDLFGWALFDASNPKAFLSLYTKLPVRSVGALPVFRPDVAKTLGDTREIVRGFQIKLTLKNPVPLDIVRRSLCIVSDDPTRGKFLLNYSTAAQNCHQMLKESAVQ